MRNLFKAFLFRLRKDLTFRITLFIGLGLSVLFTLIYLAIDLAAKALVEEDYTFMFCTGQNLFLSSLSPAQNFGIAIPVNLISFTVLEFTQGSIRNKIIAGNSKAKIYFSLVLSGLVFTFALIITYSLLSLALGSMIGGFDINGVVGLGRIDAEYFWKMIVLTIGAYIFITTMTIFFATLFRSIGPCIPVVLLLILGFYLSSTIVSALGAFGEESEITKSINTLMMIFNPLNSLGTSIQDVDTGILKIENDHFIAEIINNIVYSALFVTFGVLIFKKKDVK